MIQKRYEYNSRNGIVFTPWFNLDKDDSKLEMYMTNEPFQHKKYKNEYRIVDT